MPIPSSESPHAFPLQTIEQFKTSLPHFSSAELAEIVVLLQKQPSTDAKEKMDVLFQFIDKIEGWELLGRSFSSPHFVQFLNALNTHTHYLEPLTLVLIGLNPAVFSQALQFLQSTHLNILRHEGAQEPLQYHLNQFVHEGEALQADIEQKSMLYQQEFLSYFSPLLTIEMLDDLFEKIDQLRKLLLDYLERVHAALAIAWQTDRIDLIDKLSSINEQLQYQLAHSVGHPSGDSHPSTGLYSSLEQSLSSIFDRGLKDEDAALEGLTQLSIWHLKDYWELGFLPFITDPRELDLDPAHYSEDERSAHHKHLFALIQQQLDRLKIGTVAGLKKNHIFSKPLLICYIEQNQHLLFKTL